jgi:hypothetical protein
MEGEHCVCMYQGPIRRPNYKGANLVGAEVAIHIFFEKPRPSAMRAVRRPARLAGSRPIRSILAADVPQPALASSQLINILHTNIMLMV